MLTPMMQQYMEIKEKNKDSIVFYRLGDFYEMFFDDAKEASAILGLTLTGRDCGLEERAPMCGVPFHSCDPYITKLVNAGKKVAICEQVEDPKEAKGIVKREIVRVVTPGTITLSDAVDENKNNFLACIYMNGGKYGFCVADSSTGEIYATKFEHAGAKSDVLNEIAKFMPSEVIFNEALSSDKYLMQIFKEKYKIFAQSVISDCYDKNCANEILSKHYGSDLADSKLKDELILIPSAVLFDYLEKTQMTDLRHMKKIQVYESLQYLSMDSTARYNLELTKTMRDGSKRGSLLGVIDKTCTPMGGRMIQSWIMQPLVSCHHIKRRHKAVEELFKNTQLRDSIREVLKTVNDMERLVSKIEYQTVNGKDLNALKLTISKIKPLSELIGGCSSSLMLEIYTDLDLLEDVYSLIDSSIDEDAPFSIREGKIIKRGYDDILDGWVDGRDHGRERLKELEQTEKERTKIKNLKVGYNKVFGYYIEVTKSYLDLVPEEYIRKQTLANAERYITPELKEIEDLVLRSDEKITDREYRLFCEIRDKIKEQSQRIQKTARAIANTDVLASFAEVSVKNGYVMPEVDVGDEIKIKDGRHPVVEYYIKDSLFVPNDTYLDRKDNTFSIITGPNMAGKSTYMRQIAIIVVMAQMGCFVPAKSARIGIADKIFTRIGASDDLASGQSTFMVEMNEMANIINNATNKSLLIIDEIGRGTSTFDGLAIAWAIAEYISDKKKLGARTLFATHYHELTALEDKISCIKNYCITAKKRNDDIVFLRKIVPGHADESYGIEVAKLAGISNEVVKKAKKILSELEEGKVSQKTAVRAEKPIREEYGMPDMFCVAKDEIIDEIRNIQIDVMSPIEALNKIFELKSKADKI